MAMLTRSLFLLAGLTMLTIVGMAQDAKPTDVSTRPMVEQPPVPEDRGAMLKQLNLSPEQVRMWRRINQDRNPILEVAQTRLKAANKALDTAIYADQIDEADVQAKLREVHAAQAEVVRIRSMKELALRRMLTPDQLTKFRVMRERFEQAREDEIKNKKNAPRPGRVIPQAIKNALQPNVKPKP